MSEDFLRKKLAQRLAEGAIRSLRGLGDGIDFTSNDYLGIVRNRLIEKEMQRRGGSFDQYAHGSTGSRLLSGHFPMIGDLEQTIAAFHQAPAGLMFQSGYDANLGLLSALPQKGDTVLYDQFVHASLRDGIRLSFAQSFAFAHNDTNDLERKLRGSSGEVFIVTESVFSMGGELAPLQDIATLAAAWGAHLIVDEAHATGVVGRKGEGLVQQLGLQDLCFARVHTFGKALGCHGAIVLGSARLVDYLVNFCRPFIYTTAMSPAAVAAIRMTYEIFPAMTAERERLQDLIAFFRKLTVKYIRKDADEGFLDSPTAIQGLVIPGNERARELASALSEAGLEVRAILYPSVARGAERLRIILHSFNTEESLKRLVDGML